MSRPLQVVPRNRQDEGGGARGQHQAVVGGADLAAFGIHAVHQAAYAVDLGHRDPGMQGDAVRLVPGPVVEHALVERLLALQHGRQQDAVVVGMGFGAEDGDLVQIGCDLQQLFQGAHTGHAVAHQHPWGFFHRAHKAVRHNKKASTRGAGQRPAAWGRRRPARLVHRCTCPARRAGSWMHHAGRSEHRRTWRGTGVRAGGRQADGDKARLHGIPGWAEMVLTSVFLPGAVP